MHDLQAHLPAMGWSPQRFFVAAPPWGQASQAVFAWRVKRNRGVIDRGHLEEPPDPGLIDVALPIARGQVRWPGTRRTPARSAHDDSPAEVVQGLQLLEVGRGQDGAAGQVVADRSANGQQHDVDVGVQTSSGHARRAAGA